MLLGRRSLYRDPPDFKAVTQAPNHLMQSTVTHLRGEEGMVERFLQRVREHNGPWFDDLNRRSVMVLAPERLTVSSVMDRGGQIIVQDLLVRERWSVDYQCMHPISELEAIARAGAG